MRAEPLRLLLVTHYFPAHRGGVEVIAGELARRLAADGGIEVEWHASDCDPPPAWRGLTAVPCPAWNATERRLGIPYPLWSPAALRRLAAAVRRADVVHVHDCLYAANLLAGLAARRAGVPLLVTQHVGMVPYRNPLLRLALGAANRALGRAVLAGAGQVVFESAEVRRYFERFLDFRVPPLTVQNGVDTGRYCPAGEEERAALRRALGLDPVRPVLLFVGRFVEKKGLPLLRALALELGEAQWLVAGWGPLAPEDWGLANVRVLRDRHAEDLIALYRAADALVLPSVGEGMPLVVQEALACGTPALVSPGTAAATPQPGPALITESVQGEDAVLHWAARLRATLAPGVLPELRSAARTMALAQWAWPRCLEAYRGVLCRLTGSRADIARLP